MGKQWKQWQTSFFGVPKSLQMVTAAMKLKDACSLEKKLWSSVLKSRDITLPDKGPSSQSYDFFSSSHVWLWELDHKEGWALKNWCFELWCWRRLLRVSWTARSSNQSILKEINPEYSSEGLIWSWSFNTLATWSKELTHWKRPWCWERLKAGGEGNNRRCNDWIASPIQWI